MMIEVAEKKLTAKDYASDQDVKWCPGCGDYSILKQVQSVCAELALDKDETVFISGIGCSSRFPYYMDTYGIHSIHGRGPAFVMGLKTARPELNVWMITGDGDSLSIGGNHFIHLMRRNINVNVLLFNNQIYGLTKGQYSPTSEKGKVTKSTPYGSIDHPFNPLALAMGADATFVARTLDRDPKHMRPILVEGEKHKGTSLIEIYQNCNIFNDGAFFTFTEKATKAESSIFIEHGAPLIFGMGSEKGIVLDGFTPKVVNIIDVSESDLWVHDKYDRIKASILTRFFDDPRQEGALPRPFGIFYQEERALYETGVQTQVDKHVAAKGAPNLDALLEGPNTWTREIE
jgi:2-oxoglutarate ferredoxin oxidoreductase subunit beta|tara:strand:- start:9974 stop:11008 length:1035 start_codon:yes stop_codon:yes gene_type:complete